MLPVSVSDILKALEAVPGWKAVVGLPKRLAALEARVKALEEGRPAPTGPSPTDCPACGAAMKFVSEAADPVFGVMGVKQRSFRCPACDHASVLEWTQAKGYGG